MQLVKPIRTSLLLSVLFFAFYPGRVLGQTDSTAAEEKAAAATADRDRQHDFDPVLGSWKYHLKGRLHPLTGSTTWVEFEGTGVCYKVWDGRAELDTIEVDGPTGHIEGLTLRTYNPQSHQWSLYWANSKDGKVVPPPDRRIQRRTRRVLRTGYPRWQEHLRSICLDGHQCTLTAL